MWLVHVNGREVRQGSGAGGGSGFVDLKYEQVFAEAAVAGGEDAGGIFADVEQAIGAGDGRGGEDGGLAAVRGRLRLWS